MDPTYAADNITADAIDKLITQYPYVVPDKLLEGPKKLDNFRYERCTAILKDRKLKDVAYLTKTELTKLVDWKLSHGTFRPSLSKLMSQNSAATSRNASQTAFGMYDASKPETVQTALSRLESLKGVGPATASLILSIYDRERIPFFSDELYRWCFWYPGKGQGWDRRISYSWKQYFDLVAKMEEMRERLGGVPCVDLEKIAYVLAKTEGRGLTDEEVRKVAADREAQREKRKAEGIESEVEDSDEEDDEKVVVMQPKAKTKSKAKVASKSSRRAKRKPTVEESEDEDVDDDDVDDDVDEDEEAVVPKSKSRAVSKPSKRSKTATATATNGTSAQPTRRSARNR